MSAALQIIALLLNLTIPVPAASADQPPPVQQAQPVGHHG